LQFSVQGKAAGIPAPSSHGCAIHRKGRPTRNAGVETSGGMAAHPAPQKRAEISYAPGAGVSGRRYRIAAIWAMPENRGHAPPAAAPKEGANRQGRRVDAPVARSVAAVKMRPVLAGGQSDKTVAAVEKPAFTRPFAGPDRRRKQQHDRSRQAAPTPVRRPPLPPAPGD